MVEVAKAKCPALVASATREQTRFRRCLSLLGQCHEIYDQNYIDESQCNELGKWINAFKLSLWYTFIPSTETLIACFMKDFRSSFPDSTIPVKMHMLEEHTVPWVRRTHVGFGLLGEQGAESIHARFNALQRTYHSVPDRVKQLLLIVKEHLLSVAPEHVAAIPPPKRMKQWFFA